MSAAEVYNTPFINNRLQGTTNVQNPPKKDANENLTLLSLHAKNMGDALRQSTEAAANSKIIPFNVSEAAPEAKFTVAQIMEMLCMLEVFMAKYHNELANAMGKDSTSFVNAAIAELKHTIANVDAQEAAETKADKAQKITKIVVGVLGWFAALIMGIIGVVTGNPTLIAAAVIVATTTTLYVSGATDKMLKWIGDKISESLQKGQNIAGHHYSKTEADLIGKIIADVLYIVVIIAVTIATCGAAAPELIAQTALEEGAEIELQQMGVQLAEEIGGEVVAEAGEAAASGVTSYNPFTLLSNLFAKLPTWVNASIFAGSEAIGSSNFFSDLMALSTTGMQDEKKKDILKTVMSIILGLITAVIGMLSMSGIMSAATAGESMISNLLKKVDSPLVRNLINQFSNLASKLGDSDFITKLNNIQLLGNLGLAAGQGATGYFKIELGNALKEKGSIEAWTQLIQTFLKMVDDMSSEDMKTFTQQLKNENSALKAMSEALPQVQEQLAQVTANWV